MITISRQKSTRSLIAVGLLCILACKKSPVVPVEPDTSPGLPMPASRPAEGPTTALPSKTDVEMDRALAKRFPGNPAEQAAMRADMKKLDAQLDEEERLAEARRRSMVSPAPPGFKPEPVARKIRLKLILEKNKIRLGELPRFRLEMTNVGREAIDYSESASSIFLRHGRLLSTALIFYATDGDKKRTELMLGYPPQSSGPPPSHRPKRITGLSEVEKEELLLGASGDLRIKLLPGETLRSVGDDESTENFKPLVAKWGFLKPGIYRLQVELDDRPEPVTEERIQDAQSYATPETLRKWHDDAVRDALGPVSSNAEIFEVTR